MLNAFFRACPRLRAALIGLAICSPSFVVAAQAWAQDPPAAPGAPAPFASDRLTVQVIGQGPDVILIHGLASSREVWRATADRLKATHRLHLVQMAGFAGEPWTHGDGAFVQPEVDELARYIRQTGLQRPAIIGHSMGALSGLLLAQQHPELVGRLLSVESLPFYSAMFGAGVTVEQARGVASQMTAAIKTADAATFRAQQEQSAVTLARDPAMRTTMVEWSMATDRAAMAAALRDVMTTDARPGLAAMSTPVTALYAADADGGAPAALADALWARDYATLPGVQLIRVDASRHFIMADQPERFAELVDAFLVP